VTDSRGHLLPGVTVTFTFPASGPGVQGSNVLNAVSGNDGFAKVNVFANNIEGVYTLTVRAGQATATHLITNLPPKPVTEFHTATHVSSLHASVGQPFVFPTLVLENGGDPVPYGTATLSVTTSSEGATATFSGSSSITVTADRNGLVTLPQLTANAIENSIQNVADGNPYLLYLNDTSSLRLYNAAGLPASLTALSGGGQSAQISTAFAQPLKALVTDANGHPLSGVSVSFAAPSFGASAAMPVSPVAITDNQGVAAISVSANGVAGSYFVTASALYVYTALPPIKFLLTNGSGGGSTAPVLGTSAITVGPGASFGSVPLRATADNTPWTAETNDSWLHVTTASGVSGMGPNNAVVQFTADANDSTGVRAGALTIAGQTVSVTQAGANFQHLNSLSTLASNLNEPSAVAVDATGNVFYVDDRANTLTEIDTAGVSTVLATTLNKP
jgi:hypothetical protein